HTFTGLVFPTARGITQRILIFTDRLTCRCATHIVPEGRGVMADLQTFRITRKPMRVLGHGNVRGIDLDHYSRSPGVLAEAERLSRPDAFTFIFIGRLVGDKGINELVRAFTKLHALLPHTRLILVGPEESELDPLQPDTICAISSCPAIEAVGHQADVRPWLAAADALVFPSYREGFPNVVIEAGAMGLPAIVTDINGSREIITHGRNGLIIPPRSADALYSAMHSLATDAALTATLAANARPMIASRFDRRYVTRCLLDYYRSILPDKH
ncbi:MAG: glycosyltransferase, partial [Muribaculaceae bacterium]